MSDLEIIGATLRRTARRQRFLAGWRGLWRGFLVGAGVYLLALVIHKVLPVPPQVVDMGLWLGLACLPAGAVAGAWRRVPEARAARFLDARAGLKERLGTAWEVAATPDPSATWKPLVLHDAAVAAGGIDPRRLLPVGLPRSTRWTVVLLAVAAGLGFVPEYRSAARQQQAADQGVIQDVGRNLVQVTRRELAARPPEKSPVREAIEGVGELGERLQSAKLTRDDALRDLTKATESLREQALELARNPALRRLEQAARNSGTSSSQTSEALQRQMESLQKALGERAASEDAAREMQRDLQKLQQEARGMAGQEGAAGEAARQQMAQALAELSRKAQSMGMPMENLDAAAAALRQADVEQFLQNLDTASQDLERMAEMARTLAQLQQQAARQGKDLAEQLKNGQAQAASETLRRMIEELQKAGLTPGQLAQIANEVKQGAQAGQNYGKVGELLQKAQSALAQGENPEGARQLAAAREELERLMDQMGDAQSLMAAMQALQKAQMCVGNGQCWGSQPGSRPGFGKGGRGGRGVGTWSDSDAWAMPDSIQDLWDNSGINRPDMAGRGQTEREAAMPDGLTPTKIKGQMQPGGPMPSITLRGVSIKGQSRVAFTEAVAAAQSEAESALDQDQVPKAYQNAVRDYFDDLK